jgi:large subunit ribosomal protein L3
MKERKLGILGLKVGMTQLFDANGSALGVTVLELGPCTVLGKRTQGKHENGRTDAYNALIVGFGKRRENKLNKPEAGALKAAGGTEKACRYICELRVSEATLGKYELGTQITIKDLGFKVGDLVDVQGTSKGKGFQGVMKRHNFGGFRATHGTHEYFRHGGSIGCRKWPGRVFKGRKMPGHMGDRRVTTQNMAVAQVREDDNVLVLHGAVAGCKNGFIMVRPAIKSNPTA